MLRQLFFAQHKAALCVVLATVFSACAKPEYDVKLAALPSGVEIPKELQEKVRYDAAKQSLIVKDHITAAEKEMLLKLSDDKIYRRAVQALYEANQPDETPQKGEMLVGVEPALMPLAEILVKAFNEKRPEAKIMLEPMSASEALSEIANKRLRFAITIRDSSSQESAAFRANDVSVQRRKAALDAFCFIVHPQNPTTELGFQQVKYLFTGKVKDWSDINKNRKPLPVTPLLTNDGRSDYLRDSLLAGEKFSDSAVVCKSKEELLATLSRTPGAIGYVSMYDVKDVIGVKEQGGKFVVDIKDTTRFKVVAVKGAGFEASPVLPLQGYVANGEYPASYAIQYFQRTVGRLPAGFSGFLYFGTPGEGQEVFFKNGLVPFTQKIVIRQ
ncbi:MAG: substrate-binding domain-containing protein [Chloroherpetonaceae bacterium]|nr:substrate-binding domain-containing protein [Chloroherpetonaceae bacterium]